MTGEKEGFNEQMDLHFYVCKWDNLVVFHLF